MDHQQLERILQSIGKECFVKYYYYFNNQIYSTQDLIELLFRHEGYEKTACATRISKSRKIIEEGKVSDALNIIISSKRLDNATILKAKTILKEL